MAALSVAVSSATGKPRAADVLGRIAMGLGIVAAAALGGYGMQRVVRGLAPSSPRATAPVRPTLQRGETVQVGAGTFFSGNERDIFRAHGNRFVTEADGLVSGGVLARQVKQRVGPDYVFKPIQFQSCRMDYGGKWASQGQAFSNEMEQLVIGVRGMQPTPFGWTGVSKPGYEVIYRPQTGVRRRITRVLNETLYRRWKLFRT